MSYILFQRTGYRVYSTRRTDIKHLITQLTKALETHGNEKVTTKKIEIIKKFLNEQGNNSQENNSQGNKLLLY